MMKIKKIVNFVLLSSIAAFSLSVSGCASKHDSFLIPSGSSEVILDHNDNFDNRIAKTDEESVRGIDIISKKFKEEYGW